MFIFSISASEATSQNASAVQKNMEEIVLCSNSAMSLDKEDNQTNQKEASAPTSVHTTESPEALYSVVKKKPKAD